MLFLPLKKSVVWDATPYTITLRHASDGWLIFILKVRFQWLCHFKLEIYFKTKSVIFPYELTIRKNIERHTAHTIVLWPNPKQWVIVHTSDLMMIIRQRIYILSIIPKGMAQLKRHSPTYCITDNRENMLNSLRPRQHGRHFADDTFNPIFLNENIRISIKISLKFVSKVPINNITALVQIMAWRRPGAKPLSEPMTVCLLTHICVTPPQWVHITHTLDELYLAGILWVQCLQIKFAQW